jgi:uncharacterized protein YyaL (SSP411 family)
MATLLVRLARLYGDDGLEREAAAVLRQAAPYLDRAPQGFGQVLSAMTMHLAPPREVAVVGPSGDPATDALRDAARDGFHPEVVYAFGDGEPANDPPLLAGKGLVDGRPAVYVCERFTCRAPLTDADAVAEAVR